MYQNDMLIFWKGKETLFMCVWEGRYFRYKTYKNCSQYYLVILFTLVGTVCDQLGKYFFQTQITPGNWNKKKHQIIWHKKLNKKRKVFYAISLASVGLEDLYFSKNSKNNFPKIPFIITYFYYLMIACLVNANVQQSKTI